METDTDQLAAYQHDAPASEISRLVDLLRGRRVTVLSGAGLSTESGIPDYRGPSGSLTTRRPIQYREFTGSAEARRRYWARNTIGRPRMNDIAPNAGHYAVARLQAAGAVRSVITQNVDGLHQAAGATDVIELHGSLAQVVCLDCGRTEHRDTLQERLLAANPLWLSLTAEIAPDGDAELPRELTRSFSVPACRRCGGVLKPDLVFFGENVPRPRVEAAASAVDAAELLWVIGSSLTVWSGFRFVKQAAEAGTPVVITNMGETRGDPLATLRIDAPLGRLLPRVAEELAPEYNQQVQNARSRW
ncbi:MAG: NAD-dependent protein deacetylase [Spirochaetaceae bacterium]